MGLTPPVSTRLRTMLDRKGYSIASAAESAGMSRQQLHQILSGKRARIEVGTLEKVVEAIGATLEELFKEDWTE
jgi:transcriptional regulator with XRE-family HTH domain